MKLKNKTCFIFLMLTTLFLLVSKIGNTQVESIDRGFIKVKGHQIYYEDAGVGEPVFFIHGGYLDQTIWDQQVDFFNKKGFRTIRFDDVGHGKSKAGQSDLYGYEIISALADTFGLEKINLIGLSWGAMLATDYALEYPEKTRRLILISPGLNGWEYFKDTKAEQNFKQRQLARENGDKKLFVEYFQKNWTDGPNCDSLRVKPMVRKNIENIILKNTKDHWQEDWSKLIKPPAIDRLDVLKTSTLVITGILDGQDIQMIATLLEKEVENLQRIEIKKVAHTLNLEKPKKTNRIIHKFLKQKNERH